MGKPFNKSPSESDSTEETGEQIHDIAQPPPPPSSQPQRIEAEVMAALPSHSLTAAVSLSNNANVIEILSDSDDVDNNNKIYGNSVVGHITSRKRQRIEVSSVATTRKFGGAHHHFHGNHLANGTASGGLALPNKAMLPPPITTNSLYPLPKFVGRSNSNNHQMMQYNNVHSEMQHRQQRNYREPFYISLPNGFVPTWNRLLPKNPADFIRQRSKQSMTIKSYQLSLLNVSDFTITGLSTGYDVPPTSVSGLRTHIKQISRKHGKAVWQRNTDDDNDDAGGGGAPGEGGGKWRIPLGAYHAFYTFLKSDPMNIVEGIPEIQLKIASLGRARLDMGFPPVEKLLRHGVPISIANSLAPFQRGGVDFVVEKEGRALIADDMGLGKTIQAIASMSVYVEEWPLLILSPSTARYHWESELLNWLGESSSIITAKNVGTLDDDNINNSDNIGEEVERVMESPTFKRPMVELKKSQINVLTSSRDPVLRKDGSTRVVICSYGLAPNLVLNGKICANQFKCAIVDESHMLKNKATKRTKTLLPLLSGARRVVLLSGTPAFARPLELWPQLIILKTERLGWFQDESTFFSNYVRGGSTRKRAELHTMLTGTVMIRRLKTEILKSLPRKIRERALLNVTDESMKEEFKICMDMLRMGKGQLGAFARKHKIEKEAEMKTENDHVKQTNTNPLSESEDDDSNTISNLVESAVDKAFPNTINEQKPSVPLATLQLDLELQRRHDHGMERVRQALVTAPHQMTEEEVKAWIQQMEQRVREEVEVYYQKRMQQIWDENGTGTNDGNLTSLGSSQSAISHSPTGNNSMENSMTSSVPLQTPSSYDKPVSEEPLSRKTVLSRMYSLTGKAKVPFIVEMLKRWLGDSTKGKLCIFAHHIFVLDSLQLGASLSNNNDSQHKFIRIDGSTSPKTRQDQINLFQRDPSVRIALLGITAAGVAVTLTASSNVWFTELFWTPAIMIQAEDRCHRIGQQAQVHCLYIIAQSTLDELLWKMIEKKLQDLGEFVEGKEKVKLVVDRTYRNQKELMTSLNSLGLDDDNDDDNDINMLSQIEVDDDIQHDIEELGKTEQLMMRSRDAEDDEGDEIKHDAGDIDAPTEISSTENKDGGLGQTEDAAICLSDDDDVSSVNNNTNGDTHPLSVNEEESEQDNTTNKFNFGRMIPLPRLRLYKMLFGGPTYGVEVSLYEGRMVVKDVRPDRVREFGTGTKPCVGDVFVAVGGRPLPVSDDLMSVLQLMHTALLSPPAEVIFAEDAEFADHYAKFIAAGDEKSERQQINDVNSNGSSSAFNNNGNTENIEQLEPIVNGGHERKKSGKKNHVNPPPSTDDVIDLLNDD